MTTECAEVREQPTQFSAAAAMASAAAALGVVQHDVVDAEQRREVDAFPSLWN